MKSAVDSLLVLENLKKSFGGLTVTDLPRFSVGEQGFLFIIGPNGAGKSSLLKQIGGFLRPDRGKILFQRKEISSLPPHRRQRLGISQTFQVPSFPEGLSVFECLRLARNANMALVRAAVSLRGPTVDPDEFDEILEALGMECGGESLVKELTHGDLKLLDFGCAWIQRPKLLLLDEPTAGLSLDQTSRIADSLKRVVGKVAAIVVEHDMGFVRQFESAEVAVLNRGALVARGLYKDIESNERIREIYFGSREELSE